MTSVKSITCPQMSSNTEAAWKRGLTDILIELIKVFKTELICSPLLDFSRGDLDYYTNHVVPVTNLTAKSESIETNRDFNVRMASNKWSRTVLHRARGWFCQILKIKHVTCHLGYCLSTPPNSHYSGDRLIHIVKMYTDLVQTFSKKVQRKFIFDWRWSICTSHLTFTMVYCYIKNSRLNGQLRLKVSASSSR